MLSVSVSKVILVIFNSLVSLLRKLNTKTCFRSSGKEKTFLTGCAELWD